MKNSRYFFVLLIATISAAFAVWYWLDSLGYNGYVLIGFGRWSFATTFIVFVSAAIVSFFALYMAFRTAGVFLRLPKKILQKNKQIKLVRSQDALVLGLLDLAAGKAKQAEKILSQYASNSSAPLLHHLAAAYAASAQGNIQERDQYLKQATAIAGEDDFAVAITRAKLYLSHNQFELALKVLAKLQKINSDHSDICKMLQQIYSKTENWKQLLELIPSLQKHKILGEVAARQLEISCTRKLLSQAATTADKLAITAFWQTIPASLQAIPSVGLVYYQALADYGEGATIAQPLLTALTNNWDEDLLLLYISLDTDANQRLETAQQWLQVHPSSAVLLYALGKISNECGLADQAEQYLLTSIKASPSVEAYQLLGDILAAKGDLTAANANYKNALTYKNLID